MYLTNLDAVETLKKKLNILQQGIDIMYNITSKIVRKYMRNGFRSVIKIPLHKKLKNAVIHKYEPDLVMHSIVSMCMCV